MRIINHVCITLQHFHEGMVEVVELKPQKFIEIVLDSIISEKLFFTRWPMQPN